MGAKTKVVGGGNATQTGADWNALLQGIMQTGSAGSVNSGGNKVVTTGSGLGTRFSTVGPSINNTLGQQGLFQNAINNSLAGNIGDTSGINDFAGYLSQIQNYVNQGVQNPGNINAGSVDSVGSNSGLVAPNIQNPGQIDVSQFTNALMGLQNSGISLNPNLISGLTNPNTVANYNPINTINPNDPQVQAIEQLVNQNIARQVGDARERFGINNTSSSTGASDAEAQLKSQIAPQLTNALGELARQRESLNQSAFGLNAQTQLQNAGLNQQGLATAINALLNQGGLNLQANAQNASNIANAGQLSGNAQAQNASNNLATQGLQQQQFESLMNDLLQRAGLNANIQAGNADRNLAAQNANANNNLQANAQFQNALGMLLSGGLNNANLNLSTLGMQQNAQQNVLGQLFNSINQASAIGTPQAQVVQQPSGFSQALGALTGIAGMVSPFLGAGGIMGLFGNGGTNSSLPVIPGLQNAPGVGGINLPNIQLPYNFGG